MGPGYTWCSVFTSEHSECHIEMEHQPGEDTAGQARLSEGRNNRQGSEGFLSSDLYIDLLSYPILSTPFLLAEAEVYQTDCTVTQGQGCLATCLPQCQPAQPGESES